MGVLRVRPWAASTTRSGDRGPALVESNACNLLAIDRATASTFLYPEHALRCVPAFGFVGLVEPIRTFPGSGPRAIVDFHDVLWAPSSSEESGACIHGHEHRRIRPFTGVLSGTKSRF